MWPEFLNIRETFAFWSWPEFWFLLFVWLAYVFGFATAVFWMARPR